MGSGRICYADHLALATIPFSPPRAEHSQVDEEANCALQVAWYVFTLSLQLGSIHGGVGGIYVWHLSPVASLAQCWREVLHKQECQHLDILPFPRQINCSCHCAVCPRSRKCSSESTGSPCTQQRMPQNHTRRLSHCCLGGKGSTSCISCFG